MDDWDWEKIADHTPEKFICPQRLPGCSTNSRAENNVEIFREYGDSTKSSQDDYDNSYRLNKPTLDSDMTASVKSVKSVKDDMLPEYLIPGISGLLLDDSEAPIMKRRGRGTFSYGSDDMYNDIVAKEPATYSVDEVAHEDDSETRYYVEPPRNRPQTSARVAKRLIAQGIGMKLSSPEDSESRAQRKKEEETRRSRIITRQAMRDDAWGSD